MGYLYWKGCDWDEKLKKKNIYIVFVFLNFDKI